MGRKKTSKSNLEKKIREKDESETLTRLSEELAFNLSSVKYRMHDGRKVNIQENSYSYSAGTIKEINYAVFKLVEEDYVQSDIGARKEFIPELAHYAPSGLGKEIDIISVMNLKNAEEAISDIVDMVKQNIEKSNLFSLEETHPMLNPIDNLRLYGLSSAFSSVYIKSIMDPVCMNNFRTLERSARVFMDYFIMNTALKIGEKEKIDKLCIPENYLETLRGEIFNSRAAYKRSIDNFFGAKTLLERDYNGEIMH